MKKVSISLDGNNYIWKQSCFIQKIRTEIAYGQNKILLEERNNSILFL